MSKKIIEKDTAVSRRYITSFLMYAMLKHSDILDDEAKEKTALYREALIDLGAKPKDVDEYENFIKRVVTGVFPSDTEETDKAIERYRTPIVESLYDRLIEDALKEEPDEIIMINYGQDNGYDDKYCSGSN